MLHKLSLDTNPIGKYRTRCLQIDFHLVSEYCVWLSNSTAWPMKLTCCVFNKVFLVNHRSVSLVAVANGYPEIVKITNELSV